MTFDPTYVDVLCVRSKGNNPNDPYMTFDPTYVDVLCVTLPRDHCVLLSR